MSTLAKPGLEDIARWRTRAAERAANYRRASVDASDPAHMLKCAEINQAFADGAMTYESFITEAYKEMRRVAHRD